MLRNAAVGLAFCAWAAGVYAQQPTLEQLNAFAAAISRQRNVALDNTAALEVEVISLRKALAEASECKPEVRR